jgi:hypothetical protein
MLNSMKIHTLLNSCNDSHPRYNNVKLQMIVLPFFACGSDSGKAFLQIRSCLIILFKGRAFMSEFTVILHSLLICNWILPPFLFITKYVNVSVDLNLHQSHNCLKILETVIHIYMPENILNQVLQL